MEENRLKPMKEGYDPKLFSLMYTKTEGLRKKLASQIDCRRFGVDYQEILSWFDVKFIYAFNKYYDQKEENILLGHLIKSLQLFKCRILRSAYTTKNSQSIVDITELGNYENLISEEDNHNSNRDFFYDLCLEFMKNNLSENAYQLLHVQLSPPPFILKKLEEHGINNVNKIPSSIIADYFELGISNKAVEYVDILRREIKDVTYKAKLYFSDLSVSAAG